MAVKIYRHSGAHAIFIEDANGVQFLNSLQASVENGACSITDLAKNIELVSDTPFGDFVDENDAVYGNTSVEVCDALNALFQNSGTPTASLPVITSPLIISLVEGESINYELTATHGVAYEWDRLSPRSLVMITSSASDSSKRFTNGSLVTILLIVYGSSST